MEIEALKTSLSEWLVQQLQDTGKKGYCLGVSGGVDSCVLTHLLAVSEIPYRSVHYIFDEHEAQGPNAVIEFLRSKSGLSIEVVDQQVPFSSCYACTYKGEQGVFEDYLFKAILKAKLAHIDLSYRASEADYLVLGTINLDEFTLGYFVKNTCIGDLLPFAALPKKIIRDLGIYLGVPANICATRASGCVYGTTAEAEWGFTEEEVYYYLSQQQDKLAMSVRGKIRAKEKSMEHKRTFPPIFRHGFQKGT